MGDNSEMAGKKSSIDFDFSDIAGKTTQVESIEGLNNVLQDSNVKAPEAETKKPAKAKEKATGYIIAIPGEKGKFAHKDISECTPEEFLTWAKAYYPAVTASPEKFLPVSTRIRAFQQIVSWHQSMMRREVLEKLH